jgi:curved DNA-binding protein CbpA
MYTTDPHDVKWFSSTSTVEEIKALYRELALRFHPDRGGDNAVMAAINAAYDERLKALDGAATTGNDGKTRVYRYNATREQAIRNAISRILALRIPDMDIFLIGVYIWILGTRRSHARALVEIGCLWHHKRQCWYWKPSDMPRSFYSGADLGQLVAQYGYRHFSTDTSDQPVAVG